MLSLIVHQHFLKGPLRTSYCRYHLSPCWIKGIHKPLIVCSLTRCLAHKTPTFICQKLLACTLQTSLLLTALEIFFFFLFFFFQQTALCGNWYNAFVWVGDLFVCLLSSCASVSVNGRHITQTNQKCHKHTLDFFFGCLKMKMNIQVHQGSYKK